MSVIENAITYIKLITTQGLATLKEIAGGDPMVTASLLLVATTILSALFYFCVNRLPSILWEFILRHFTTVMTVEYSDYDQREIFNRITEHIQQSSTDSSTRTFMVNSDYNHELGKTIPKLAVGLGKHFMFFKGRLFLVDIVKLDSSGANVEKKMCTLRSFGRSAKHFKSFISIFEKKDEKKDLVDVFSLNAQGEWKLDNKIVTTSLEQLALNPETREYVCDIVNGFLDNEDLYRKLGIAYKSVNVLHGIPGSGKTSLIRSIAKTYGRNICIVPASAGKLCAAFSNLPPNPIVVIEDFDSISATVSRKSKEKKAESNTLSLDIGGDYESYSLSEILNTLDGIVALDNVLVFLTTNVIENIDNALLRNGRTDNIIELPTLSSATVKDHLINHYPMLAGKDIEFPELSGCNLYEIKKNSLSDGKQVIRELERFKNG